MFNNYAKSELELMVGKDEKILWQGKPNKRGFILEGIFNPLLPFALIWFLIDSVIIAQFVYSAASAETFSTATLIPFVFFLFHLMPVWMYLGGILFVFEGISI